MDMILANNDDNFITAILEVEIVTVIDVVIKRLTLSDQILSD